jgi:hypothetical protein
MLEKVEIRWQKKRDLQIPKKKEKVDLNTHMDIFK